MQKILAFCGALLVCSLCAAADDTVWIGTWGAPPLPPVESATSQRDARTFRNQTLRQIVQISAGGNRVRLRLSNEYGDQPLTIGAARIARADRNDQPLLEDVHIVTFSGQPAVTIPPGAPFLSDPIELGVDPLTRLSISLYFPADTGPCTCHWTGRQEAYVSAAGDFSGEPFAPATIIQDRAFLTGVEVEATRRSHVIVVLGDSLADGVGSMLNENHRWPDYLAARLARRSRNERWGIVNAGVSGNGLLRNAAGANALARFDRDVLAVSGVTHVIVSQGIDELGAAFGPSDARPSGAHTGQQVSADSMIAGYQQLIARAHARGLKIYGATLTPYEDSGYYSDDGEAVRTSVNAWIRESREFDGVLDFDAALRDSEQHTKISDGLHSGDHIHPNDDGYRAIADSIELSLFR